jgi:ferrous iron transport protein A
VPKDALIPLELVNSGQSVEVVDVAGDPGWVGRVQELGIRIGAYLRVLRPGSPCLLQVGDNRFCLRCTGGSCVLVRTVPAV